MDTKKLSFKEFLAMAPRTQVVAGAILIIVFLATAVSGVFLWEESSKSSIRAERDELKTKNGKLEADCEREKFVMAQKYEHDKNEAVQKELVDAKAKLAEREKDVDDAIRITKQVLETQAKTQQKVRKIRTVVSKIVTK